MNKAIAFAAFALVTTVVNAQRVELFATLVGPAKGKSVWKTRDQIGQLQAELSVEAERLRPGAMYRIVIGTNTWQLPASALGTIDFDRRYIGPIRPRIVRGTVVQIKTAAGAIVLTGTYQ